MNFFRFESMLIVVISILRAYDIAYIFIKSFSRTRAKPGTIVEFDIFRRSPELRDSNPVILRERDVQFQA